MPENENFKFKMKQCYLLCKMYYRSSILRTRIIYKLAQIIHKTLVSYNPPRRKILPTRVLVLGYKYITDGTPGFTLLLTFIVITFNRKV